MQCRCECHFVGDKLVKMDSCKICAKFHNDLTSKSGLHNIEKNVKSVNRTPNLEKHQKLHSGIFVKGCSICDFELNEENFKKKLDEDGELSVIEKLCRDHGGLSVGKDQCPACRYEYRDATRVYCEFGCGVIGHVNALTGSIIEKSYEEHYDICELKKTHCVDHGGLSVSKDQCRLCKYEDNTI